MNPRARAGQPRGFMMIEMLAALILLTAFALVATRVFTWSMRVTAEAPAAEGQVLLFDSMLEQLRADAWSGASVRTTDDRTVSVSDGAVRWNVRDDGSVARRSGGETRTWLDMGARVRFEPDDAGLIVRVLDRRGNPSDRILLPSEVELLRRVGR
jgi:type II secretory pathway pseudopilin PulG